MCEALCSKHRIAECGFCAALGDLERRLTAANAPYLVKPKVIRIGYIYLLRNLINGKGYVGQHWGTNVNNRWNGHISDSLVHKSAYPLHRAIRKYGPENFSAEVVWTGAQADLDRMEQKFIKKFNTFADDGMGYNLTRGGQFGGGSYAKSSRKKIGIAITAAWQRPEVRAKFAASNAAMRVSVSIAHKIRLQDPEERRKLSEINIRRYEDPKEHAKSSKRAKKYWSVPEIREKKVKANQDRWKRPEERAKASEAALKRWAREGERERSKVWFAKISAKTTGRKLPESTKQNMSKSRRAYLQRRDALVEAA